MSNNSLPVRGTDPPFSHKSVVSIITNEQNIICSKTLELSANEKEGKKTSNDNNYYTCHILLKPYLTLPVNMTTLYTTVLHLHCTQSQIITDGFFGGCFAAKYQKWLMMWSLTYFQHILCTAILVEKKWMIFHHRVPHNWFLFILHSYFRPKLFCMKNQWRIRIAKESECITYTS